ncbi:PC4-domain-containing protein [Lentinus tigrinus ALCF2SS1-6]|uniref:PC4-domain-containing protein n=1 Tax=Lentinus tigrinus ALCF2SS1-6 TaxID=1328759 RepID=A0A5C2RS46_9APHY|nr:PC4-domain-containing protein [Lentinus tigrinus ALCF2SS1-6]
MVKRKAAAVSSDDDETYQRVAESESPERPLQTARRSGKKSKIHSRKDDSDDSEEEIPIAKSVKKPKVAAKPSSVKKPKAPAKEILGNDMGDADVGVNERGERYVDLGKKKRATVTTFKGGLYLDVREFWGDEGDFKPGKKGIMLNKEQWETLKKSSDVIDLFFAKAKK